MHIANPKRLHVSFIFKSTQLIKKGEVIWFSMTFLFKSKLPIIQHWMVHYRLSTMDKGQYRKPSGKISDRTKMSNTSEFDYPSWIYMWILILYMNISRSNIESAPLEQNEGSQWSKQSKRSCRIQTELE